MAGLPMRYTGILKAVSESASWIDCSESVREELRFSEMSLFGVCWERGCDTMQLFKGLQLGMTLTSRTRSRRSSQSGTTQADVISHTKGGEGIL